MIRSVLIVLALFAPGVGLAFAEAAQGSGPPDPIYGRILFVGNSITLSRPTESLEWGGLWGMAATQADRDYKHRIQQLLAERQGLAPQIGVISADLHRWERVEPVLMWQNVTVADWAPDLIIVQMGDNAPLSMPCETFEAAYEEIAAWAPAARLIALGKWGGREGDPVEACIQRAAWASGMEYVYIRDLHTLATEAREYAIPAVAWHPNDLGMDGIAHRTADQITTRRAWLPIVDAGASRRGSTIPP